MGRGTVRAGPAVEPTETNAGTDNSQTDPRVVEFKTPTRPILLAVPGAFTSAVRAKINAPKTNDFDNDSDDDGPGYFTVAPGATKDVSVEGQVAVQKVSFVTQDAGDDLDLVSVVGWPAGAS
jgi:hypothetical protein